jgi:cell division septal protein FtsQ
LAVVAVATVAGAAHASVNWVWPAIVGHPYFRLEKVRVKCDTDSTPAEVLAARAGLFDGTSVWEVDVEGAVASLRLANWVRDVRINRRFPNRVSLDVKSREAVAATPTADGPYLIDAEGVLFREEGDRSHPDLPYVTGWDRARSRGERIGRLRTALAAVVATEAEGIRVSELNVDASGKVWVYPVEPRIAVHLGDEFESARAAARLRAVLEDLPEESIGELYTIDLAYDDRVVLRTNKEGMPALATVLAAARAKARGETGRMTADARADGSGDRG